MTTTIIIVNYNAGDALRETVESLLPQMSAGRELLIVDNASADASLGGIAEYADRLRILRNADNAGFAAAVNRGIRESDGEYVLLLNPDITAAPGMLDSMEQFMAAHADTGIAGGRVNETDGSLQPACRRGFPTPWVAFCRFSGLARAFPNSKLFARYNLTFLDEAQPAAVDAVSGSFMMIRRNVLDQVGHLDEDYFMYAEDIDICLRTRQAGWEVRYNPDAVITHTKGVCADTNRARAKYEFYNTMWTFHKKHFAAKTFPPLNWAIWLAVAVLRFVMPRLKK